MKGIVEAMVEGMHIPAVSFKVGERSWLHPGKTALFKKGREVIATLGELHPQAAENFGIKQKVYLFEMDVEVLMKYTAKNFHFDSLPKFPATSRDLAIVVDTPPTEEKMAEWINRHLSDTEHRTGDRGFDVGTRFSAWDDTYKVIPAYRSLHDDVGNLIDECPTHCAFTPHQKVSARMRNKLLRQLERVS